MGSFGGSGHFEGVGGGVVRIVEPLCAVFRRKLRSVGLKYTPERARILDTVVTMTGVWSVDQLIEQLRGAGGGEALRGAGGVARVSKATVYRTIKLLLECGIVQQIPISSDQGRYHVAYGASASAIVVNTHTLAVESVEMAGLAELCSKLAIERGAVLDGARLVVYVSGRGGGGRGGGNGGQGFGQGL
jgi:Fur family transcriptional regulator, ferric uptake regulator